MKQVVMTLMLGCGVAGMTGCAEMQQQAGSLLGQPAQPQQIAMEGGQPVQSLGGQSNQATQSGVAQEGSSMAADMAKEAASTVKSEVSSSIRSAIRGAFSR